MPVLTCPECGASYRVETHAGRPPVYKCLGCQAVFGERDREGTVVLLGQEELASTRAAEESVPEALGRFEILGVLGRGGMGVVYHAFDPALRREVALKVLSGAYAGDARAIGRFAREAGAAARLRHPNVVRVFEVGELEGKPFYTMERVEGESVRQVMARMGTVPTRAALKIAREAARALAAAHEAGIVHRDVKPGNILLERAHGEEEPVGPDTSLDLATGITGAFRVLVTDFGIAMDLEDASELTRTGDFVGTPAYMSPEQAEGDRDRIGPPSDVYGLGTVLYEMLTGRPPFEEPSLPRMIHQITRVDPVPPRRLAPSLHPDVETIVLKAMAKEARVRYESAVALADDIDRYLRGDVILARPAGVGYLAWRRVRKHAALSATVAVSLILLAGLSVYAFLYRPWRDRRDRWETERARVESLVNAKSRNETLCARLADEAREARERGDPEAAFAAAQRMQTRFQAIFAEVPGVPGDLEFPDRLESEGLLEPLRRPYELPMPETHLENARAGLAAGEREHALVSLALALGQSRADPRSEGRSRVAEALTLLGRHYEEVPRFERARAAYAHAIEEAEGAACPRNALLGLARSLFALERFEETRPLLDRLAARDDLAPAEAEWVRVGRGLLGSLLPLEEFAIPPVRSLATGDVDGDGRADVVVADTEGWLHVLDLSRGPPRLLASGPADLSPGGCRVVVGDADGDGRAEIAIASGDGQARVGSIGVWEYEDGSLILRGREEVPAYPLGLELATYDPEAGPRLTLAAGWPLRELRVYRYDPSGLRAACVVALRSDPSTYEIADLDGDGRAELVLGLGPWQDWRVVVAHLDESRRALVELARSEWRAEPGGFLVARRGGRTELLFQAWATGLGGGSRERQLRPLRDVLGVPEASILAPGVYRAPIGPDQVGEPERLVAWDWEGGPENFSIAGFLSGAGTPWLLYDHPDPAGRRVHFLPLAGGGSPWSLGFPSTPVALDVDGDGDGEILLGVAGSDGAVRRLRIHGRGGARPPRPAGEANRGGPARPPSRSRRADIDLECAALLADLGRHDAARDYLERFLAGSDLEERDRLEAQLALAEARAALGHASSAIELFEEVARSNRPAFASAAVRGALRAGGAAGDWSRMRRFAERSLGEAALDAATAEEVRRALTWLEPASALEPRLSLDRFVSTMPLWTDAPFLVRVDEETGHWIVDGTSERPTYAALPVFLPGGALSIEAVLVPERTEWATWMAFGLWSEDGALNGVRFECGGSSEAPLTTVALSAGGEGIASGGARARSAWPLTPGRPLELAIDLIPGAGRGRFRIEDPSVVDPVVDLSVEVGSFLPRGPAALGFLAVPGAPSGIAGRSCRYVVQRVRFASPHPELRIAPIPPRTAWEEWLEANGHLALGRLVEARDGYARVEKRLAGRFHGLDPERWSRIEEEMPLVRAVLAARLGEADAPALLAAAIETSPLGSLRTFARALSGLDPAERDRIARAWLETVSAGERLGRFLDQLGEAAAHDPSGLRLVDGLRAAAVGRPREVLAAAVRHFAGLPCAVAIFRGTEFGPELVRELEAERGR